MTLPTIHLNGDTAQTLTDGYSTAMIAVRDAIEVVCKTYPNGRNFYPQGPQAITAAMEEHRSRLVRLEEIAKELEELAIHCDSFIKH